MMCRAKWILFNAMSASSKLNAVSRQLTLTLGHPPNLFTIVLMRAKSRFACDCRTAVNKFVLIDVYESIISYILTQISAASIPTGQWLQIFGNSRVR